MGFANTIIKPMIGGVAGYYSAIGIILGTSGDYLGAASLIFAAGCLEAFTYCSYVIEYREAIRFDRLNNRLLHVEATIGKLGDLEHLISKKQ